MNKKPILVNEEYYLNEDGSKDYFIIATEYAENDWALVKKDIFSDYQFRDLEGNLSETFFHADPYKYGISLVMKERGGDRQYRDGKGNLSEIFFNARPYLTQYKQPVPLAIVQKVKGGDLQFRDIEGNLSEPFRFIRPYFYGYKVVKNAGDKLGYIELDDILESIKRNTKTPTM